MSVSTYIDSMYKFCWAVVDVFDSVYLRELNMEDTQRLLCISKKMEFPDMLKSIDYMH
jgi:hypothetical protein